MSTSYSPWMQLNLTPKIGKKYLRRRLRSTWYRYLMNLLPYVWMESPLKRNGELVDLETISKERREGAQIFRGAIAGGMLTFRVIKRKNVKLILFHQLKTSFDKYMEGHRLLADTIHNVSFSLIRLAAILDGSLG